MDLERERGITIKARAVAMKYTRGDQQYELNLIDTPGHVDFHYEVSRSLACCEGAILVVDAAQGVEAQTLANAFAAMNSGLHIVPFINKIDLQNARTDEVLVEMEHSLAIDPSEVLKGSAKAGLGIAELLDAVIDRVPPPKGDPEGVLQAMVFDSHYDDYRGAITYVRMMNGTVRKGQKVRFLSVGSTHEVVDLGQFVPGPQPCESLQAGQVGYLICNIKSLTMVHIGDTISVPGDNAAPAAARLQRAEADGLLRPLSVRRPGLQRAASNTSSYVGASTTTYCWLHRGDHGHALAQRGRRGGLRGAELPLQRLRRRHGTPPSPRAS